MNVKIIPVRLISLLLVSTLATLASYQSVQAQGAPAMAKPEGSMMKPEGSKGNVATRSGQFVKAEHPTQGNAKLITEAGKAYVEFDSAFKTDAGPDLYVILYRTSQPPIGGIKEKDYVRLAKLQKTSGTQRYAIPSTVKPQNFASVAIWCRQFNATFGYASLSQ